MLTPYAYSGRYIFTDQEITITGVFKCNIQVRAEQTSRIKYKHNKIITTLTFPPEVHDSDIRNNLPHFGFLNLHL